MITSSLNSTEFSRITYRNLVVVVVFFKCVYFGVAAFVVLVPSASDRLGLVPSSRGALGLRFSVRRL